ncbi:antitoxin [Nonomuraea sp. NPDC050783]|uniref:antitoxin n=1 Tax=Nonomuraea sp. NPDC050783 TaxID=3154634 RepID=UPI003466DDC5
MSEWLRKAENLARGHSKQADQVLDRAERFAKERTGHKYDEQIEKGVDAVQRRYGGGDVPGAQEPVRPATGHPTTGHPTTGHPATGHPATEHPTTGQPVEPPVAERERDGRGPLSG